MWRCFLIALCFAAIKAEDMEKSVIIIGAGLSGFSAAARLMENGFTRVTVLEAEDRIGGRVNSVDYLDGKIDLGAQWCHGQGKNIIYEAAHETFDFGVTPFFDTPQIFLLSNGSVPDQGACSKLSALAYKHLSNADNDMASFNGSLGDYVSGKIDEALRTSEFKSVDPALVELVKEHVERETNGYFAANSWLDISAKLNAEYGETDGNQHLTWKRKGFVTFFDYITKKALDSEHYINVESKVRLNKRVTNINYDSEQVLVETSDGQKLTADHVIFTGSLGVLKKYHKSLFTPGLPQEKVTAIERNAFGAVGKIFLEFAEPFWTHEESEFVAFAFLWNEAEREEARASGRDWLFGIAGFFMVDEYPNLLEAFVAGDKTKDFEEISDEKLIEDCVWFLERFSRKQIPQPKLVRRTKWLTNENFLGTYSFMSNDAEKFKVGPRELAKSVKTEDGKPAVLFAGEAADFEYPSYANGAVSSGYRAADELIAYLS